METLKQLRRKAETMAEEQKRNEELEADAQYVLVPKPSARKNSEDENRLDAELLNMQNDLFSSPSDDDDESKGDNVVDVAKSLEERFKTLGLRTASGRKTAKRGRKTAKRGRKTAKRGRKTGRKGKRGTKKRGRKRN